jgi:outer membrane protein OmpA-like peptidoglycan-associated protein
VPDHRDAPAARSVLWLAAVVTVPALLAGVALAWVGPGIADDLRERSGVALAAAGFSGVEVRVSGRDVVLADVPAGAATAVSETVAGVTGVRTVEVPAGEVLPEPQTRAGAPDDGSPTGSAPTAAGPTDPAETGPTEDGLRRLEAGIVAVLAEHPLTFPADSAELTGPAAAAVPALAALLREVPAVRIELEGHAADTPGPPRIAQALSEERAAVVARALTEAGIDPTRLVTRGAGDSRPLDTLAASRRVEVAVE